MESNLVLPEVQWEFSDFFPYISEESLVVHLLQLHMGYVNRLNHWGAQNKGILSIPPSEVLSNLYRYIDDSEKSFYVNNMGGHVTHTLLWGIMNKNPRVTVDSIELTSLGADFNLKGADFKNEIINCGLNQFGSGWIWGCLDSGGYLRVYSTLNHNTPYMRKQTPLFCIDLWEHAYFLDFFGDRRSWLESILNFIDFSVVNRIYEAHLDGYNLIDNWCMKGTYE